MPVSGARIVADAMRYRGRPYVWGVWDCSGMVNHVLSADLGLAIPGYRPGGFTGPRPGDHGPVVQDYAQWGGAVTVTSPAPGDLVIWWQPGAPGGGHIGIYTGGGRMISALDPQFGTLVTPVAGNGPGGVAMFYRRVTGTAVAPPGGAAGQQSGGGSFPLLPLGVAAVVGLAVLAAAGAALFALAQAGGFVVRAEGL